MTTTDTNRHRDMGLLMLRVGAGMIALIEAASILISGPIAWLEIGEGMEIYGFQPLPEYWGVLFGVLGIAGGLFFALGLLHRLATVTLLVLTTCYVGIQLHFEAGWSAFAWQAQSWIIFAAFLFIGTGRLALDEMLAQARERRAAGGS